MTAQRPDVEKMLSRLKDFQRRTVDYVFNRLYVDPDRVDRFLLADEVGLGKTLVARGIVARAVDHLWDKVKRIDVIYICSNSEIARQNINRLKLEGQDEFAFASRLTLLPLHTKDLASRRLNFVSFTPGTSFDMGSGTGIMEERAVLYCLLEEPWQLRGAGPKNVLQGGAQTQSWRKYLDQFQRERRRFIDKSLANDFAAEIEKARNLRNRFADLCERFQRHRANVPYEDRVSRNSLVSELRRLLARCCIKRLEPDLVILDEFQRFRYLLHGEDDQRSREVAELAKELFEYRDQRGETARVLLLSATPYKMYTLSHEAEDDHYSDFLLTARFLFGSDAATAEFERELRAYRTALCLDGGQSNKLSEAKGAIERRLRKVMCRTERLAVSANRNGMLEEKHTPALPIKAEDLHAYAWLDRVAVALDSVECLELWKSGAYLLNFMDDYDLKRKVHRAIEANDSALQDALRNATAGLFTTKSVERYKAVDPGNARLRALIRETVECGGWQLLWMPASLPYYAPNSVYSEPGLDGFTKALVFSSWQLVPKVISVIASYDAERRMVRLGNSFVRYSELRERQRPLLRFIQYDKRLTGMPLFTLLYPCITLATEFDPLEVGRRLSARYGSLPSVDEVLAEAATVIGRLLEPAISAASSATGPADERWYWAAPLLLDRERWPCMAQWLEASDEWSWQKWSEATGDESNDFIEHVKHLRNFFNEPYKLGQPPGDLLEVLAKVAVGSPAVVALRALSRLWPDWPEVNDFEQEVTHNSKIQAVSSSRVSPPLLGAAGWIAMAFRSLFNRPENILLLRGLNRAEPYWERVLDYAVDGNLQAVMDEYVHVLADYKGLVSADWEAAFDIAEHVYDAITLRTVALSYDEFAIGNRGRIAIHQHRMRCRYALRFGDGEAEEGGDITREDQVRNAFNSPFRPFILASTSVGQEGLDFHLYCHAVYHWNLPSNPVDLEQREGRVHRYKGHAIRKNLASRYGLAATGNNPDPWEALFRRAAEERGERVSELEPYWVFEGPWKIERRIPLFPLSREAKRLEDLKRSLALYRLVFGQPRQEELLRLLHERVQSGLSPDALSRYQIDLSPQSTCSSVKE